MATQLFLLTALFTLVYAIYPFDNSYKAQSILVTKTPKQLLSCMAKCIDSQVSRELEKCDRKFPTGVISGIHGGKRRRVGDHMVTMTRDELYKIVNCVSQSKNRIAQKEFDVCNDKQPPQTYDAFSSCGEKIIGETGFAFYDVLAAQPKLTPEIFECIRQNTVEYTPKEAEQQISFETCAREVYSKTCEYKFSDY